MGGGMMGRRMGYSEGSKKVNTDKPKEKLLAKQYQEEIELRLVM